MFKVLNFLIAFILVSPALDAQAQEHHAQLPATGSIVGHVFLGDSHLPARMAYVTLLPVNATHTGDQKPAATSATVQTGLDGAYAINNVLPGAYFVVAGKLGYATAIPIPYLDPDTYNDAPAQVKEQLAAVLVPTVVVSNHASQADIVLDKGAVIAGSVRFDDGAPDVQGRVSLLQKDKSGKWAEFTAQEDLLSFSGGGGAATDDQGNFRLTGLPPGEYLLRTTLELQGSDVKTPGVEYVPDSGYRWDIYFGDGIRPRDAKTITLKSGEESNGNIVEIPLARLHSISGTVFSETTGAPINQADVELHNADDDSTCTVTAISRATGQFHFPYVIEGEYTLKIRKAADVAPGSRSHDEKPLRTYDDISRPLIVTGEMNGISVQMKASAADK